MEPMNSQVKSPQAKEVGVYPLEGEGGGEIADTSAIAWTASNQSATQVIGTAGPSGSHARSQSITESLGSPTSGTLETQQLDGGRSEFHPPLLRQNSSSLPSFKYLISSVDDPNDKNPIPPIAFSTENPHASNSSPIRKQHICYSCKKSFPSKNSLSKHKQIHGERSHICGDCNAKFHTKKDLTRHRDTVHGENSASYVCPVTECARSNPKRAFSRRDNLRQHILQLHDKRYLDEIKNPNGVSSQTEKNPSRSPEGESSPFSDDISIHPISMGEAIEDTQNERVELRTPMQMSTRQGDLDNDEDSMMVEQKGKSRAIEYSTHSQQLEVPPERSYSPQEESRDVVMLTPKLAAKDFESVPELQEPLPELKIQPVKPSTMYDLASSTGANQSRGHDIDEEWVMKFLEDMKTDELEVATKLTSDGLKARYPEISSQRRLDCIKFALLGFDAGFSRGYRLAQTKISEVFSTAPSAAPVVSRSSLSVTSPAFPSDVKAGCSPLTPISVTSPTRLDGSVTGFFTQPQRETKEHTIRNEASGIVVPSLPRSNAEPAAVKVKEVRPTSQAVAADTENVAEVYRCTTQKCNKTFTKKSEWKKHMQRHRRPFFCTFHWQERSEVQRFGSKDDWRRHEEHRHYQSEFYKCPGGSHESCRGAWALRSDFEKHLDEHHKSIVTSWTLLDGKVNEDTKNDFFQKHHNGTDYVEDNFWCGFCAKLIPIPPEMTGRRGKEIRVNHVADHFHKEQKDIRLWVKYSLCNLAETSKALEVARSNYEREINILDTELEILAQQRQLPPIKDIFGPVEPFSASSLASSPVAPDLWICCECQHLAQNRPNFVYVMNLGKESECTSNEHPAHTRCPRCSIARSQFS
ncbi:uncharacterized protein DFL_003051 [Arthrobotrys flagrans]|uniref:C2H2-type domain-containing protein n=1 Tax=Arthrobotrys flagrans TaxID=97331 RepID=A0A437AC98_ARTFL|nr:hypothetical protein DFL_003051 [Arthrobotrys flagrans]